MAVCGFARDACSEYTAVRHAPVIVLDFWWMLSAGWSRVLLVLEESPGSNGYTAR
jgi:hypothetical protein